MKKARQAMSWAGKNFPPPLVATTRRTVGAWGRLTARWRMEPTFIIVGAQRCGTTSLFRVLCEHPQIVRPTSSKGIGYFDLNYHRGPNWYKSHFPLRWHRRRTTFESSGYYLFHPLAAERIAAQFPNVKIVALVRDPVIRAHSAHKHESARGFEMLGFTEAIAAEESRLAGEAEKIRRQPNYQSFSHRHHGYVARGQYAHQIERYIDLLGHDRVHVVDADRMFVDPAEELNTLFDWLGLDRLPGSGLPQENARPRKALSQDEYVELARLFEESDNALAHIMGRTPSWRQ